MHQEDTERQVLSETQVLAVLPIISWKSHENSRFSES